MRSRLRKALVRALTRGRTAARAEAIVAQMLEFIGRQFGDGSDPWVLVRNCVLCHVRMPPEIPLSSLSDRKLSSIMRWVVGRLRGPRDEVVAMLLLRSFVQWPGRPGIHLPPPTIPPRGAAAARSARDAYGENA